MIDIFIDLSMSECEHIAFISTVAYALSKCCSTDDLAILSANPYQTERLSSVQ
jgi:hypothetical protein